VSWLLWLLVGLVTVALVWLAFVVVLFVVGRRQEARALAGFIPDCVILIARLMSDPRVPRRRKVLFAGLVGYLALPFDLVPDFIRLRVSSTTCSSSDLFCGDFCAPAANNSFVNIGPARSSRSPFCCGWPDDEC
jgi:Protein of unknown function (DUF1232)